LECWCFFQQELKELDFQSWMSVDIVHRKDLLLPMKIVMLDLFR
jgi:hypothetical protein